MTEVDALRQENARLKRQLSKAGLFDPRKVPAPRTRAPGHLWAQCGWAGCRKLARYPRTPGTRLSETPCVKCGLPLERGANKRGLQTISDKNPRSRIARILENLELGFRAASRRGTSS